MNSLRLSVILFITIFFKGVTGNAQDKISLIGQWAVQLDADSVWYKQGKPPVKFEHKLQLPGTTDEAHLGTETTGSDYGILTRKYKYIGPAWYQRQITIPASWKGKNIHLFLERVLWESKIFIDGKLLSTLSPLYVPHRHNLGVLQPGLHTITICINNDMIHPIGDKGHGYTEYTQSIWNGIVGKLELKAEHQVVVSAIKTYPDIEKKQLGLEVFLSSPPTFDMEFSVALKDLETGKTIKTKRQIIQAKQGREKIELFMNGLTNIKSWDEFNPHLYELTVTLRYGGRLSIWKDKTGFRKLSTSKHKILVNNKATFIRGNLDCVHFPLTGYPSCNVKDWETIFQKYKDYGLNTVRFHSWTPPKAAFEAADKMGIYIQTEIIWLDWWMAGEQKDRPEMNTKGYPQGLGKNPGADAFVQAEMKRVLDEYGNHPSFMFFCIGNELGNSDFDVMEQWIKKVKNEDPRRLYAVSTARKIMPVDDYMVTHNIPNVGGTYRVSLNKTDAGLEASYSKAELPVIAHEVGQYPVYPEWKEIDKYKGVLKARNLEGFKAMAEKNGIAAQDKDFHHATGALQQLLYKNYIENITLAPSSAGFQMLSMNDYQGQGEALIGWLDCFWEDKGTTSPEVFRGYSNAVVPLIRTNSFTYTINDTLKLGMEVANNFKTDLQKKILWEITANTGTILHKGATAKTFLPQGQLTKVDSLSLPLTSFPDEAGEYSFRLFFDDNSYSNSWSFFVFPVAGKKEVNTDGIYISNEWNVAVDNVLAQGGKVLLMANKLGNKNTSAPVSFTPLFWSASFFPGQSNQTLGSMINNKSAAFRYFPTHNFTNWQWLKVMPGARYFNLSNMPKNYIPLVQPVSDFHYNDKLGSIFETRVGNGKLLISGYDLQQKNNAYTQQLYYSITSYMKSSAFAPEIELPIGLLKEILKPTPEAAHTSLLPEQFKEASLLIKAGTGEQASKKWRTTGDSIVINKNYQYNLDKAYTQKLESGSTWKSNNFTINLLPPAGVKGYVYLHFVNPENQKMEGMVTIEGRELKTGKIPVTGKWIKIFMMREDTNDGKVAIHLVSDDNEVLMVDQLVITEEE
jgi:beta-galactosidase